MPRMSKQNIASLKDEYNKGEKPKALLERYNITKHALYHHVGSKKKANVVEPIQEADMQEIEFDAMPDMEEQTGTEDPLIDFEQIAQSAPQKRNNKNLVDDDDIFNLTQENDNNIDLFHPDNLLSSNNKPAKEEKWSLAGFFNKSKIGKDDKKSPEEVRKEEEQTRLKLVYQVRLYLYTFRDSDNMFVALGIENDNKKINKYIQDLYKRKVPELKKVLDFIKFHIRHNNNSVTGNFCSSIFFTIIKVVEVILTKMGIDLTGLSDELRNDPDVVSNLKEIEIEMTSNKMNLGAKTDILLKICTKGLAKFTENKMINKVKSMKNGDTSKTVMDTLNSKPVNDELKNKYNDI